MLFRSPIYLDNHCTWFCALTLAATTRSWLVTSLISSRLFLRFVSPVASSSTSMSMHPIWQMTWHKIDLECSVCSWWSDIWWKKKQQTPLKITKCNYHKIRKNHWENNGNVDTAIRTKKKSLYFVVCASNASIAIFKAGNSFYMGRLWHCMCSCQSTVGLIILSLN